MPSNSSIPRRKRRRLTAVLDSLATIVSSSSTTSLASSSHLFTQPIDRLSPFRSILQSLWTDEDVARLLRVCSFFANSLLRGYTFQEHVFEVKSLSAMRHLKELHEQYDLRATKMCLRRSFRGLKAEKHSGRSPLPSSLTHLLLAPMVRVDDGSVHSRCMFGARAEEAESIDCEYLRRRGEDDDWYRRLLWKKTRGHVRVYISSASDFNWTLRPHLLPHGLQQLQISSSLNTDITAGCIPSTVKILQLSDSSSGPLLPGALPAGLLQLGTGYNFQHYIPPGLLPPHLERLKLCPIYKHRIDEGVLPATLLALDLDAHYDDPPLGRVLPPSLTHLSYGAFTFFRRPLTAGSFPPHLVSLFLGNLYFPLLPGTLPSSLRVLVIGKVAGPLVHGWLPDGLLVLQMTAWGREVPLNAGDLPQSLVAVGLTLECNMAIGPGAVPAGVKLVVLPRWYYGSRLERMRLSPQTEIQWYVGA